MRERASVVVPLQGRVEMSSFRPHPLLRGPHLQTILPNLLRPLPRLSFRRERLELPDGDFVDLGWCGKGDGPLVVLLHGLTGGFESKYLRGTARRLLKLGMRCVIVQMRGAGPEPNRLTRCYHHGASDDLKLLLDILARRKGERAMAAVGWSLGANVLLKYLGEAGTDAPLKAAVAVSAPFQIRPCAERLRTGLSRIYQSRLLRELKAGVQRKYGSGSRLAATFDLQAAYRAMDFFAFDDAHTAPVNGFRNAEEYYARAACGQFLRHIATPTLILHAADDPFMRREIVPLAAQLSPQVTLELSERGGHVGFVSAGRFGLPEFWMEKRIAEHLARQFT